MVIRRFLVISMGLFVLGFCNGASFCSIAKAQASEAERPYAVAEVIALKAQIRKEASLQSPATTHASKGDTLAVRIGPPGFYRVKVRSSSERYVKDNEVVIIEDGGGLKKQTFKSYSEASFKDGAIRGAVGNMYALIEGSFGALIMVVAGIVAVISAAMGAYRLAVGLIVVSVGCLILRSFVSLFFGANFGGVGVGKANVYDGINGTPKVQASVESNSEESASRALMAKVVSQDASLRLGPGSNHDAIYKVALGTEVKVLAQSDRYQNWYRVETSERQIGFLDSKSLLFYRAKEE